MNKQQQDFLERLALRIPRLFEAIAQGNVKSEYIIGVRYIGVRHVRLKLVAEVVDPGANPLATHGQMRPDAQRALRAVDPTPLSKEPPSTGDAAAIRENVNDLQEVESHSGETVSGADRGPGPASRKRRSRKR